ncbi:RNA polymerase sigma-70 factor [Rhodohalobacter sp. SW132]|uniref:RNA polymerase sigma factor n=1 Tax=Rhodohalobacter sp. SW132 TaxID=2293433 RepID=UPI000E229649|nr:RNA polymerase sigma-70 factor [Rhodohalobacter sp. SW132]REL33775.1 RNA polymerase sigma-70 factor [Rhodohalobacter sp. SW132]
MKPETKFDYQQFSESPLLEKQWVRKVREEGDRAAFEKIFRTYYKQLTGYAFTFIRCPQHAEDIVQTVFLRIWSNKESWDPPGKVKPYLFAAIKNESLNEIRHKKIQNATEEELLELFTELKSNSTLRKDTDLVVLKDTIQKEIDCLPIHCKEIFLLNRNSGLTYREIANHLDISINTVNTQMGRALKMLRKNLSDYAPLFLTTLASIFKTLF